MSIGAIIKRWDVGMLDLPTSSIVGWRLLSVKASGVLASLWAWSQMVHESLGECRFVSDTEPF